MTIDIKIIYLQIPDKCKTLREETITPILKGSR